jgi:hypothetical protein
MEKKYYTAKDLAKLITYIEGKEPPFTERSARDLLSGEVTENKKKLEKDDPSYLSKDKPHYYSKETIAKVLNERKDGKSYSYEEISSKMDIITLLEKESARAGEAEDAIESTITMYDDEYSYSSEDPYSYENMVQPEKIRKKAKQLKLEIILETILEEMGYKFEEEEFYSDLLKNAEAEAYMDDTELLPINILEKREKIKNPKKHYIKKIDKN